MTKKEFAKLKKGQLIVVLIVRKGRKTIREPMEVFDEPCTIGGSPKIVTYTYGILDEKSVDFLNADDVREMMDKETIRHNKRVEQLNKLLKEVSK